MVMAYIYTLVGEYDKALDEFEKLLAIPAHFSIKWLESDPLLAPLREIPRCKRLIKEFNENQVISFQAEPTARFARS